MTWYVEQLLRDGTVASRLKVADDATVVTLGRALDPLSLALDDVANARVLRLPHLLVASLALSCFRSPR